MSDQTTEPNLVSVLEEMRAGFARVEARLTNIEAQLENMDIRLDTIEGFAHQTRSEILNMRAYLKQRTQGAAGAILRGQVVRIDEDVTTARPRPADKGRGESKGPKDPM